MAKTELKLKTKNAGTGQNITTTIGYVNPMANSQTLKTFGQKLNNMTTNNYVETDRVQTINVDTEEVVLPDTRQTPTITLSSFTNDGTKAYGTYTYNGDGVICACAYNETDPNTVYSVTVNQTQKQISSGTNIMNQNAKIAIVSTSTENYKSAQLIRKVIEN